MVGDEEDDALREVEREHCDERDAVISTVAMPPKLSKRQQRELEELESLKATQIQDISSDEDELTSSVSRYSKGASFSQVPSFQSVYDRSFTLFP